MKKQQKKTIKPKVGASKRPTKLTSLQPDWSNKREPSKP